MASSELPKTGLGEIGFGTGLPLSQRRKIAIEAVNWCEEHNASEHPTNIVTALVSLGYITGKKVDSDDD